MLRKLVNKWYWKPPLVLFHTNVTGLTSFSITKTKTICNFPTALVFFPPSSFSLDLKIFKWPLKVEPFPTDLFLEKLEFILLTKNTTTIPTSSLVDLSPLDLLGFGCRLTSCGADKAMLTDPSMQHSTLVGMEASLARGVVALRKLLPAQVLRRSFTGLERDVGAREHEDILNAWHCPLEGGEVFWDSEHSVGMLLTL